MQAAEPEEGSDIGSSLMPFQARIKASSGALLPLA
jgi:hypothetical protein